MCGRIASGMTTPPLESGPRGWCCGDATKIIRTH